jgi:hypothetical protein
MTVPARSTMFNRYLLGVIAERFPPYPLERLCDGRLNWRLAQGRDMLALIAATEAREA